MSIKVMTMVFDRYPEGGNERLLALAMADHARDDGSRIWPSVAELARKTMQSRSTVQRQIKRMVERGWLQVVRPATGRPGDTNEYRINPDWIEGRTLQETGVKLTPVSEGDDGPESVDKVIHTGVTSDETGVKSDERGVIAVTPESSGTVKNHKNPLTPASAGDVDNEQPEPGRPPWRWRSSFERLVRYGKRLGLLYSTDPLGNAYTDEQLRQHREAYRRLVEAEHDRRWPA